MADISVTAANVVPGADAVIEMVTAGEAFTAGMAIFIDTPARNAAAAGPGTGNGRAYKSDVDLAGRKHCDGIATADALAAGARVGMQTGGELTAGATLGIGTMYFASNTAGGIMPGADLSSGEQICPAYYGVTAAIGRVTVGTTGRSA